MAFEPGGAAALDYEPCRYGTSKLLFRGPPRRLEGSFVAVLGGTETYGKFVPSPWPRLLEGAVGLPVVNFGCMNAGVDVFVNDPVLIAAASRAVVTVIQVLPPENTSNRFYVVHPRRNDRFLRASALMQSLFRGIDFSEVHFTGHLLSAVRLQAPDGIAMIETELRAAWSARMKTLLSRIAGRKILLALENPLPPSAPPHPLGPSPHLITDAMLSDLIALGAEVVHVAPSDAARGQGTGAMRFGPLDASVAARMPTPAVHAEIAAALAPAVGRVLAGLEARV